MVTVRGLTITDKVDQHMCGMGYTLHVVVHMWTPLIYCTGHWLYLSLLDAFSWSACITLVLSFIFLPDWTETPLVAVWSRWPRQVSLCWGIWRMDCLWKSHSLYALPTLQRVCKLAKLHNLLLFCTVYQISNGHGHSGGPWRPGSNPRQGEPSENPPQGKSMERFPLGHAAVRLVGCKEMFL